MAYALNGHNAFITGGGSGIGLACAIALVRDGAHVTLFGRSAERLERGAAAVRAGAVASATVRVVTALALMALEIGRASCRESECMRV